MIDVNNAYTASLLQAPAAKTHSATHELLQASSTSTQEETETLLAQALGQLVERDDALQIRTQATTKTLLAKAFGQLEDRDDALQKRIIDFEKRLVNVEDIIEANRDLEASFVKTSEHT